MSLLCHKESAAVNKNPGVKIIYIFQVVKGRYLSMDVTRRGADAGSAVTFISIQPLMVD
jgi:hypothetical protein